MADEPPAINEGTLRLLIEQTRATPAAQVQLGESLDGKTVQVAAAASVVVGFLAIAPQTGARLPWELVLSAVLAYVMVIVAAISGLWVRKFSHVDDPQELWTKLYDEQPLDAMHSIITSLSEAYPDNETLLENKRWALTAALVGIGLEVVFVAAALIDALTS
jgi:hypothetical protein